MIIKSLGKALNLTGKTGKRKKPGFHVVHEGTDPWGQPTFQPVSFRAKSKKAFVSRIKKHGWLKDNFGIKGGLRKRGKTFLQNTPDGSTGTSKSFKVMGTRKSGKYFEEI
jgi:hypothetical protein